MRMLATSIIPALVVILAQPLLLFSTVFASADAGHTSKQPVLVHYGVHIAHLQTRSSEDPSSEFIVLFNETEEIVDLTDWMLEYKPQTGGSWRDKLLSSQPNDADFSLGPNEFFVLVSNNYLDEHPDVDHDGLIAAGAAESGGHLRLYSTSDIEDDEEPLIVDQIGWGESADSSLGDPAEYAKRGTTLQRLFDNGGFIQNTYNNFVDFYVAELTEPMRTVPLAGEEGEDESDSREEDGADENTSDETDEKDTDDSSGTDSEVIDDDTPVDEDIGAGEVYTCEGVVFSEFLPNPEGPRSTYPREEHAFIELHNPTSETIPLYGCGLQTSANSAIYWFEDEVLAPEAYHAWYEEDTGIQLPVSPSGTVYLLNDLEDELESVTYPAEMPEAATWAWFGNGDWKKTFEITPGAHNVQLDLRPCQDENQERNPDTNRCRSIETTGNTLTPCLEGQERNPETNRCRSIEQSRQLVPCGPNQERNPETNRCRNIGGQQRELVPCREGQERNPETNRCRNIESASASLVPCGPNQERNPETNRCRNVAAANTDVMGVQDIAVPTVEDNTNWTLVITLIGFLFLYGLLEWRQDFYNWFMRLRGSRSV